MEQGNIRKVVSNKNFGFIETDSATDIFFHREDVQPTSDYSRLSEGDAVEFLYDETPKGPRARNVTIVNGSNR